MSFAGWLGRTSRIIVPPNLRAWLRRSGPANRVLRKMYGGAQSRPHPHAPYTIHFDGYRNIGWTLGALAKLEADEFRFAREQLERVKPKCVWDVGANVGLWSLFFAGFEPRIEHVICFEPDPINRHFLEMNKERNRIEAMMIRDVALSDHAGTATFFADPMTGSTGSLERGSDFIGSHYGAERREQSVTLSTVDAEVGAGTPPPQFMKIDVEGHELDVLKGARRTLAEHRPAMVIEVTRNAEEVTRLLRDGGYRLVHPRTGRDLEMAGFETGAVAD